MEMAQRTRFAKVSERIGRHVSEDELLHELAGGEARIAMTAIEGIDLAGMSVDAATFEEVVFRSCTFDDVDFSRCGFTDVIFIDCRFVQSPMDRCWLNRCEFRSCSALGMQFRKSRLTGVGIEDSQFRYADFSDSTVERFRAAHTGFAESIWHGARPKRISFDGCDLTKAEFFRTPLAGIDVSTCEFSGVTVSSDFHELRGCIVSPQQAVELSGLLGVTVREA